MFARCQRAQMSEKNRSTRVGIAILYLAGCVNAGVLTTPVSESLWVLNDEQTQAAISITPAGNASAVPQPTWESSSGMGHLG